MSGAHLAFSNLSLRCEGGMKFKELFCLLSKVDGNVELSVEQLLLQRKNVLLGVHLQVVLEAWRQQQQEATSTSSHQFSEPGN